FLRRPMMVLRTLRANGSHYPFAILDGENLVTHEVVAASHDVVDSDALDQPGWNWRRCRMACCNSLGKVLIRPVTGRPICEVKPTCPSVRHRRRHLCTVQTEQPTRSAMRVSFRPATTCSALLQARLKCGRVPS